MNLKPSDKIDFEDWNWGDGELYTDIPTAALDPIMDSIAKEVGALISEVINDELAEGIDVKLGADAQLYVALPLTVKSESMTFVVPLRSLLLEIPADVDTGPLGAELQALADLAKREGR